jgi:hypothetical protein
MSIRMKNFFFMRMYERQVTTSTMMRDLPSYVIAMPYHVTQVPIAYPAPHPLQGPPSGKSWLHHFHLSCCGARCQLRRAPCVRAWGSVLRSRKESKSRWESFWQLSEGQVGFGCTRGADRTQGAPGEERATGVGNPCNTRALCSQSVGPAGRGHDGHVPYCAPRADGGKSGPQSGRPRPRLAR